jgi:cysteine-rich repeat protein
MPCTPTDCGNGTVEGSEACDDGNHYLGDGCSIYCEKEPACAPPAPCTSECGDGIKFGSEACDDANTRDGDGCSATCEVEPGWTCMEKLGGDLQIPIVYRDFKAFQDGGHVDFQWSPDPIDRTPKQDIWVRTSPDPNYRPTPFNPASPPWTPAAHQSPEYRNPRFGLPNYVYVRVRNRGAPTSAGTEQLHVYWSKASAGLAWPYLLPVTPAGAAPRGEF